MNIGFGVGLTQRGNFRYLPSSVLDVLVKYGTDAHMWVPGVGMVDGIMARNWQDGAGTVAAVVGQPVGKVDDVGGGSVALMRDADAVRPTLALDGKSNYNWAMNGSFHKLPLTAPVFQLTDNFCVVAGVSLTSANVANAIFAQSNANNNALPEMMFDSTGRLGVYTLGGGATLNAFGGPSNTGVGPIVATMVNNAGTIRVRRDGVQITSLTLSGVYATATTAAVGAFPTLNATEFLPGAMYSVVAIKGTVSDADLLTVENFVAANAK